MAVIRDSGQKVSTIQNLLRYRVYNYFSQIFSKAILVISKLDACWILFFISQSTKAIHNICFVFCNKTDPPKLLINFYQDFKRIFKINY